MTYVRVYAPNNEPFDVPRWKADELILEKGWTMHPYETVAVESVDPEFVKEVDEIVSGRRRRSTPESE